MLFYEFKHVFRRTRKNQQEEFLEQDTKENQEELIKSIQTSIAKNQELEKISFEKWENKIQERVLPKLKRIVTHKLQESITSSINTQLESFKKDELDLSSVFEIQRKNTQIAYRLAIGGLIGIIALSIIVLLVTAEIFMWSALGLIVLPLGLIPQTKGMLFSYLKKLISLTLYKPCIILINYLMFYC